MRIGAGHRRLQSARCSVCSGCPACLTVASDYNPVKKIHTHKICNLINYLNKKHYKHSNLINYLNILHSAEFIK